MAPEELIELAWKIAYRYAPTSPDLEDIAQEVVLALWQALDTYQPDKGATLDTYLWYKGHFAVIDFRRQNARYFKIHGNTKYNTIPVEFDAERGHAYHDPLPSYNPKLTEALKKLSPRNQRIVLERLYLDESAKVVSERYGVSEFRVWQIVQRFRSHFLLPEKSKSSPAQPTACQSKKPARGSTLRPRQSRPIESISFIDWVQGM